MPKLVKLVDVIRAYDLTAAWDAFEAVRSRIFADAAQS